MASFLYLFEQAPVLFSCELLVHVLVVSEHSGVIPPGRDGPVFALCD